MLSTQQMAHLIALLRANDLPVVLTGSPDPEELEMIDNILALVPDVPVWNAAGKITLKELSALIASAKALICVDSVPLHIASAVKTPVVALFGPTSETNWGPWMHPIASV
jgi:heptosyltransferase-3